MIWKLPETAWIYLLIGPLWKSSTDFKTFPWHLHLRNNIIYFVEIRFSKKNTPNMPQVLSIAPLPLRYSVLCCGQFPRLRVMYCSSAQLRKEKRERTRAYTPAGHWALFTFLFCQATGDWKDSDWSAWRVMGRISKTFRKVAEEQPLLCQEKMADGIWLQMHLLSFRFFN